MAQRNLTPDTREEQDAYDDPTQVQHQLQDAETDGSWTTADQDQYDATVRDSKGESGDALRDREKASGTGAAPNAMNYENTAAKAQKGKQLFSNLSAIRKIGPIGVTIVLIIGGALVTTLSLPVLVLQHIEETLTNALDDSNPAINVRTKLAFKLKVDGVKNGFAESTDGKCNIKCRFSTVNDKMRRRMEAASGVKFELEKKAFGRYVIKSATFPAQGNKPALKVTNGADFVKATNDPIRASAFYKVFNPGSDPFLANNWVGRLMARFNLTKKTTLNGDTDKENRDQLARSLGTDDGTNADGKKPANTPEEQEAKLNGGKGQDIASAVAEGKLKLKAAGGKVTNVAGAICAAYDVGKAVNAAYSVYKVAQYAVLFNEIVKVASQARVGNLKPATATFVGNMVTLLDMNKQYAVDGKKKANPFYKKSFTDSAGYKMAAYGDDLTLTEHDKTFSLNPTGVTGLINQLTSFMIGEGSTQAAILVGGHETCKTVNSPVVIALSCIPAAVGGTVAPIVGNAVAFIGCIGINFAVGAGIGLALNAILPGLIKTIVLNDLGTVSENLVGAGLGDATYVGAGEVLGSGKSSMYGMTPGTADQIQGYKVATAQTKSDYALAEKADASGEPLNVNNQYSFLGSAIRSSGILDANMSTPTGALGWVGSLMGRATSTIVSPTYAAFSKAELYKDGKECPDAGLREIGAACNAFGLPSFTMEDGEMNMDIMTATDFMLQDAGGDGTGTTTQGAAKVKKPAATLAKSTNAKSAVTLAADDTGDTTDDTGDTGDTNGDGTDGEDVFGGDEEAIPDAYIDDEGNAIEGSDYAMFLDYCANRQINYGQTMGSIGDDDFGWQTGYSCLCNEDKVDGLVCTEELANELHFFRTYTMDKTLLDATDDEDGGATGGADAGGTDGGGTNDGGDDPNAYVGPQLEWGGRGIAVTNGAGSDDWLQGLFGTGISILTNNSALETHNSGVSVRSPLSIRKQAVYDRVLS